VIEVFDEIKLRSEIVKTWGAFGAHAELFDMIMEKAKHATSELAHCRMDRDTLSFKVKRLEKQHGPK
jgi:hypothetical protein